MKVKNKEITLEKDDSFNRKMLFGIFIFTLLLYSNSIKNNYAFDDNYVTVINPQHPNNPRIEKGIKGIPEIFKTHYIESSFQSFEYRPLVLATFAIEYQFFGSNPHVSHFISVLLYALTCMLLFSLLSKLFKNYNLIFPLLVTFLFIVHPIHTEVVDNIKCRDELLSFLFGLCAVHFLIKSIEINSKKWAFVILIMLFLFLGFLCKQTIILFFVLMPAIGYFFYDYKLKNFLLIALSFFIVLVVYKVFKRSMIHELKTAREFVFFENPLYFKHDFLTRISLAIYSLGFYLKLLIFPYPLCCYYGYNTIPVLDWASSLIYIALLFYFFIGIYALIKLPKKNIFSFAIIVFLLGELPFSNVLTPLVGIVAERFIYFASLGFCIMMAYVLLILFKVDITDKSKFKIQNSKLSLKLTLTMLLVFYSCLTIARNNKWKDLLMLFTNDVKNTENSYLLNYFAGITIYDYAIHKTNPYDKQATLKEANLYFTKAAQLLNEGLIEYNSDYLSFNTLGTIYNSYLNETGAAIPWFKKSIAINPKYEIAQFNLALCYEKENMPDYAILQYEKMIAANTKHPPVYFNLHELYITKKEYDKAVFCDKRAIIQCPKEYQTKAYINLGNVYMLEKDTLNAIPQFKTAVLLEPNNVDLNSQVNAFLKSIEAKIR